MNKAKTHPIAGCAFFNIFPKTESDPSDFNKKTIFVESEGSSFLPNLAH